MMRGLMVSAIWILSGAGVAAALFWGLLSTPESTVFTLAISAVLALGIYAVLAVTVAGAVMGWRQGWRGLPVGGATRGVLACVPVLVFVVAMWWTVGRWLDWLAAHTGEISAWFIATFNWSDVRPLVRAVQVASDWLRWVVAPFAALVWLSDALEGDWRPTRRLASPVRLAVVTVIAAATLWAPVTYGLYWRPGGLPATWVEPAVALMKFAVMASVGALGLSLIIRLAARHTPQG